MLDQRPYMLRALNEWIVDSNCTPHVLVDATRSDVIVPRASVEDGRIVLNISPGAVRYLVIDDSVLTFEARFAGVAQVVSVPLPAVLAIYARENGAGMAFEPTLDQEPAADLDSPPEDDDPTPSGGGAPAGGHLRVVK